MENKKVALKKKYKELIRSEKFSEADKKLEELWKNEGIVKQLGKKTTAKPKSKAKKYTEDELNALPFKELKVIGKKLGTTDRSKKKLIKEILALQ